LNGSGLTDEKIRSIAFETGFCKRNSGKIDAPDFLVYMCAESLTGTVSHNDMASKIHEETGTDASRQAYWERTDGECVAFFQAVLEHVMLTKVDASTVEPLKQCGKYKRILLQDSTVIQLPLKLFEIFSGVKNASATKCHARIQGIYDLLAGKFIKFSIDPYSANDISVASDIPVEAGDLVLRDRGYFKVDVVGELKGKGADSISRYKHGTTLYHPETKEKIGLLDLLTLRGSVDMEVLAGSDMNLKVRLLAMPVDEETANLRRMKAKKEMKGHAPTKELLDLMSWTIYVVTIKDKSITIKEVFRLYKLRWRIENIIKTWKSEFSFDKTHNVSEHQLRTLLTARLIMITKCYHDVYVPACEIISKRYEKQVSLMKLMHYIRKHIDHLCDILNFRCWSVKRIQGVAKYCTYAKRKRTNFESEFDSIILEINGMH